MSELPKNYNPKEVEQKTYQKWLDSGCFTPHIDPEKKPFTIMIPPPNITGSLHMGHALNNTIQDILIRYHRLKGEVVLWLPGTDHAGIATQNVVEKKLKKEGSSRHQIGREAFVKKVWEWKDEYGNRILDQLKSLGCSCDWSRLRFTLDEKYNLAVKTAFVNYYKKGWIYKGPRVVNWCPRCQTAISDIEIKYKDQKTQLYTFKYSKDFPFTIATTRPETKIADTAIAVNPTDQRYAQYIGQTLETDFLGFKLKLKIIADRHVDPTFGTGALGVTPAHSLVDFEMAQQNNLEIINIIGPDGKMNEKAGKYAGLTASEAREQIVSALTETGLMEKVETYDNSLSLCDRCDTPIEPLISDQWFVKMSELAKPAIAVAQKSEIQFYPERYQKSYLDWMENLRDWCVSRQLWWGHQLPVYYCETCDPKHQKPIVAMEKPENCPDCGATNLTQDEDVLDTWFSSALWPFATLGWPEKTPDLDYFYPNSVLCTAPDILYLWVARMIFSGFEFIGKKPFDTVYLHSTILTKDGSRMSKSHPETIIDPLEMIETYGADATRFGIIYQTSRDLQAIKFSKEALLASQKFANKLWNIARFIQMLETENPVTESATLKTLTDTWIANRFNQTLNQVETYLAEYEFGKATHELYEFTWHDLADWYIEITKNEKNISLLREIYRRLLILLHPFMPFITEEIYTAFKNQTDSELLVTATWPTKDKNWDNETPEFETLKNFINAVRGAKQAQKIDPAQKIPLKISTLTASENLKSIQNHQTIIETLARVNCEFITEKISEPNQEIKENFNLEISLN